MGSERQLKVTIVGDASGGQKAFAQIDQSAEKTGGVLSSIGPKIAVGFAAIGTAALGAGAALFKIGENFDEAFDKIRIKTGSYGEELAGLKSQFKSIMTDVPTDMGKASDAITAVFQKLGNQDNTKQIAEQFLELSRITGTDLKTNLDAGTSAINSWNIATSQQSTFLDEMFRVSQQTGISVADLTGQMAENGAVMRAAGLDWEEGAALIGTLSKAGLSASDVMPALSKSLAVAAEQGKDAGALFTETFNSIKNAPNDVEAAGEALSVFGAKAGPKMAQLIREGKLSYEQLVVTMANGKDTILGAGKDTQDFAEKWQLFKNRVLVGLEPLASAAFGGVGKAMDKLGPITNKLALGFSALKSAFSGEGVTSDGFVGVMERIGVAARTVIDVAVSAWQRFGPSIMAALTQVGDAFKSGFDAVHAIVQQVVVVVSDLWDRFGEHILDHIRTALDAIAQTFKGVFEIVKGVFDIFAAIFTGDWGRLWDGVKEVFGGVWDVIVGLARTAINAVSTVIGAVTATISAAWGVVWHAIATVFTDVWDGIKEALQAALRFIVDKFLAGVEWIVKGAEKAFGWVPFVGGKLHDAADAVEAFRDRVNEALGGIHDRTINVSVRVAEIRTADPGVSGSAAYHEANLDRYALGGWVRAPKGQPKLAIVHGGEYVVSEEEMSRTGGGGSGGWSRPTAGTGPVQPIVLQVVLDNRVIAQNQRELRIRDGLIGISG